LADLSPGGFDVKGLSLSEEMFELGEDLFDRIEVGLWVAAEVVQDDDIAGERVGARIFSTQRKPRNRGAPYGPLDRRVAVARRKTGVFRRPVAPRDDGSIRPVSRASRSD
jgi:hypothetical protein